MDDTTKLKNLSIRTSWNGDGSYHGEIEFVNEHGEVKLKLDHALSTKLLAVVADEVVLASRSIAEAMTTRLMTDVTPAIESQ